MAGGLHFVSQALLDTWAGQGRIDVAGQAITLLGGEGRGQRYVLEPAVRFLRVAGGGADPHQVLARVKTLAQVRDMGGDALAGSVVLGDVAYEVEPGFLAEAGAVEAASRVAPEAPPAGPALPVPAPQGGRRLPRDLEERRKEAEALARFLLDNLS
jgi:hypothetical protein